MLPTVILCEGEEDVSFLKELISKRHIGEFEFFPNKGCGGVTKIGDTLRAFRQSRDSGKRKAILIVGDNDGRPGDSFAFIQAQIKSADYAIPAAPRQQVQQDNLPPLSVLMIPWDDEVGCLETVCLSSASKINPRNLECVEGLVACIGAGDWDVPKQAKLRMRCYLSSACKSDPNTGLKYAWSRPETLISVDDPCFNNIADYLASVS
jgi:hypothetical protein